MCQMWPFEVINFIYICDLSYENHASKELEREFVYFLSGLGMTEADLVNV